MITLGLEQRGAVAPTRAGSLPAGQHGLKRWLSRLAQQMGLVQNSIAGDARAVRELARAVRDSDPGFSSDLYAAADRHEQLASR